MAYQRNLPVTEPPDLLAKDGDRADQFAFLEHGHVDNCASASEVCDSDDRRIAFKVRWLGPEIVSVRDLLRSDDMSKAGLRVRAEWLAETKVSIRCRYVVERNVTKRVCVVQAQGAELGVAKPCCLRQHCFEHRPQFARRIADDLQDLGRGRLLLQRLGKPLFQMGARFADGMDFCSCLRSGRANLATVFLALLLALLPFARQRRPRWRVDRPCWEASGRLTIARYRRDARRRRDRSRRPARPPRRRGLREAASAVAFALRCTPTRSDTQPPAPCCQP